MEKSLSKLLKNAGEFSEDEIVILKQELQYKELKKGECVLEKGNICSTIYFVISGSFYEYNLDSDLEKNVIDLFTENDWVLNHKSFTSRKPSQNTIQAFEESTVYELSIESIHKLIALSQNFLQMGKILDTAVSRINFFDNNNTPDEKYECILKTRPVLIQKFPQKFIASYLKITPETLSRVRKRIQ